MSGVGISFGIERIYDVMEELKLFPAELGETTKVLFVHFDDLSESYAFEQLQKVRAADIASEIYPGRKKLDKQMNYANDKKIPFVIVIGGDEMASGKLSLKNMATGEQEKLTIEEIISKLKK
jgi:histidyl-tRNA synthetase